MSKKQSNNLIQYKASELNIAFPDNKNLTAKEKERAQNSIIKGGIVKSDGRCFISKDAARVQLCTDSKGANRFYNELEDDDKYQNGKSRYASVSSVAKEISERIQEPRDPLVHEKLKFHEQCLTAFRDHPELEKSRHIEESRIRQKLPNLTKEKCVMRISIAAN